MDKASSNLAQYRETFKGWGRVHKIKMHEAINTTSIQSTATKEVTKWFSTTDKKTQVVALKTVMKIR
jgi:hypothetical protein